MVEQAKQEAPAIIGAIAKMTAACAKAGIAKTKQNTEQKYKFRGIDDVRNLVAPLQEECGLIIVPKMVGRTEKERTTKNGGFALQVVVKVDFHFVSLKDGSEIVVPMENEAVDYSDKATNKAVSQCYKTALINTFNIPTEGEDDTDDEKKELRGKRAGVFESAEMRSMFASNCQTSFDRSDSLLRLNDAEALYHEKLILMAHSDDPEDKKAAEGIRSVYATRAAELKAAARPKPSVDSVMGRT